MIRQFAKTSTPTIEVRREGDYFVIKTSTTFKTSEIKFKLDEEFEESRMDGNTVKVSWPGETHSHSPPFPHRPAWCRTATNWCRRSTATRR